MSGCWPGSRQACVQGHQAPCVPSTGANLVICILLILHSTTAFVSPSVTLHSWPPFLCDSEQGWPCSCDLTPVWQGAWENCVFSVRIYRLSGWTISPLHRTMPCVHGKSVIGRQEGRKQHGPQQALCPDRTPLQGIYLLCFFSQMSFYYSQRNK